MFEGLVGQDLVVTRNWRAAFQQPQIHQFAAAIAAGSWDRIFDPNEADTVIQEMRSLRDDGEPPMKVL